MVEWLRSNAGGVGPAARRPPPRRLAARRGGRVARRGAPRPGGRRPAPREPAGVRHARRRWRVSGPAARRAGAGRRTIRARVPEPARRRPRGPAPDAPGDRAGSGARGEGRLDRGQRPPRPRAWRPAGRHRRRADRAHPARAVRRPPPDRRADHARAADPGRCARPGRHGLGLEPTRVEGPICESTDALGVHDLPPLRRGDLVAIADTGAYAASLASTYNGRPRAPQVFIEPDGTVRLARRARR